MVTEIIKIRGSCVKIHVYTLYLFCNFLSLKLFQNNKKNKKTQSPAYSKHSKNTYALGLKNVNLNLEEMKIQITLCQ